MSNIMKMVLTADPTASEIPLLSDLHTDGLTHFPSAFQIPYQYAIGVLVKDGDANDEQQLQFVQVLKSEPYSFYHNGCSFSTVASALNGLRGHVESMTNRTDVTAVDLLKSGKIYEVSLVFRTVSVDRVKNAETRQLVEHVRSKLRDAGISDKEILEFVRAEARLNDEKFHAEPEDDIPTSEPIKAESVGVHMLYPIPLIGEDSNLLSCQNLLKAKKPANTWLVDSFFIIIRRHGTFDDGVNLDKRKFRIEALSYGLEDVFETAAWSNAVDDLKQRFGLTSEHESFLRNTAPATRLYQILCFIRDKGADM